jgi:signal transduction histidine kinase/CheY-like chemotaxis protein
MAQLHEIEELAGLGVWAWQVVPNELEWSAGMTRLLGLPEDARASFELWLGRVHADDQSTVKSYFTRLRREPGVHVIEYRVVDGEQLRTIESRARATETRIVGVDQDVTQRKETLARVAFSDRMVSIGTLAGGAAHEINNPLAVIAANLVLLEDRADSSLVAEAHRAVERIRTIVKGLTAFSRSSGDRSAAVDVRRSLELAISFTTSQLRQRARIVTNIEALPWVRADEGRLGQVFINLLVNAAEAIPEGNANQNEIRIRARTDAAGWALIDITDTGGGIPNDVAPRVFDPFFTTKPVGHGTGLGLSICHGIVRSFGGDITFQTERKKGTTFSVALPPGRAPTPPMGVAAAPAVTQRRGQVLIVDDEITYATSLKRVLSNEHEVTIVASGREAFALVETGAHIDAILCDLMMPEMTGPELHAAIAGVDPHLVDRMIFVTGGAFTPASQAFLDRVTNPCFEKPCDLSRLRAAVRRLVDSG